MDYRRKLESDLLVKINATLEPLLGANKFKAGVSIECDLSGGEQSEEIFDPARSVMVSSQRTEDNAGTVTANGVPGTASSLPRPTSRPGGTTGKASRTTENITYQSTRTVKKSRLPAGAVRKMSLAVLVDQDVKWEKDKTGFQRVLVPPPPEKLKVIHDLVAGITGFSADRGDQLVMETLPFETTLLLEPPPAPPATATPVAPRQPLKFDRKTLMMGGGALAALIVLIFVAAMLLRRRKKAKAGSVTGPAELSAAGGPPATSATTAAVAVGNQIASQLAERDALQHKLEAETLACLKLAPVITKKAEVFAKHLREKVGSEPEMAARILRSWIRDEES